MKVVGSIGRCYKRQLDANIELQKEVKRIITNNKNDRWHYFGRIKSEEDYALKIEASRTPDPNNLEDFFACTIVVDNSSEIKEAMKLVEEFFSIESRRPKRDNITRRSPDSFTYDNLRLYVKFKLSSRLPQTHVFDSLSNILFEIQIKTFLQHAWDVAAHDLIYKGEEISWSKSRVAYQVKAMLEHAEVSIREIENIKKSEMLDKHHRKTEKLNRVMTFLTKNWIKDKRPSDLIRLSKNVKFLLDRSRVNIETLQKWLNVETNSGRGIQTLNLSPYFIIFQTIVNQGPERIHNFVDGAKPTDKIVIPAEVNTGNTVLNNDKVIRLE